MPSWKVAFGIFLSLTCIILIEKIFGIHINILNKGTAMATFPGWAQILGPGETQAALLHRWIEAHRNLGPVQAPTQPPATATPTTAQNTQHLGKGSCKSKQLGDA
ncbi:uncharacterized protein N7503_006202 [Penicillium pulvis]|uniref:uncharacterized protein n=1 Tax=Penicillium pulvis TaxID=1562058 RepID=UPI0025468E6B|nr:uncharacterized protein N7503_006202 [Penicillium pulvis]KAJ5798697.1 hypothetical protein N7503_006202 [Penicillium pulvis]